MSDKMLEIADAQWIEAVIRSVQILHLRDDILSRLLQEQDPDQELVDKRLQEIAGQDEVTQKLRLVGYHPPLRSVRPRSALQAEALIKARERFRKDALSSIERDRAS
ncbi:hypothetical protein EON76_03740 [bacterium]|nr:MAG: hypothetical protein EON76_03740 [bacterium]